MLGVLLAPLPCLQECVAKQIKVVDRSLEPSELRIGTKTFQMSKMTLHTSPEVVWRVLTDYDNACRIFVSLKQCKVLEDKGATKIIFHKVKPSCIPTAFEYVLEVKETALRKLEWRRVRGDFKEVDGYWSLEPADGGKATLVSYCARVDGGFFIPQGLIRKNVRTDMPIAMACLKSEVENKTQIARGPSGSSQ